MADASRVAAEARVSPAVARTRCLTTAATVVAYEAASGKVSTTERASLARVALRTARAAADERSVLPVRYFALAQDTKVERKIDKRI
jgi:hypothetical protein